MKTNYTFLREHLKKLMGKKPSGCLLIHANNLLDRSCDPEAINFN